MKTTVELPDELMRTVRIRAAHEGRKLEDVIADLIRSGLSREPEASGAAQRRVRLPLVNCARGARPEEEMTPDRVAEELAQEEASALRRSGRISAIANIWLAAAALWRHTGMRP